MLDAEMSASARSPPLLPLPLLEAAKSRIELLRLPVGGLVFNVACGYLAVQVLVPRTPAGYGLSSHWI